MNTHFDMQSAGPAPARIVAALAGLALLSACSAEEGPPIDATGALDIPAEVGAVAAEPERDCLLVVWEQQSAPNRDFDRANDPAEGGLISCATGTTASQYEASLAALRDAATDNDRDRMLRELDIPLLYIDADGNRRDLRETDLADQGFDEVFSPEMLALMRNLDLADMTVVPDQGGFFELGAIWLSPGQPGGRPRLVTVNRQALAEAAAAEKAETPS
ncbi:hypothetical protein [Aurantiacibacter poecillastricola]|uniref:hypothetical protein n=1 Tax=Aurantiacibacter poecillastricola TaxID=3064385 RepID=UPI00273DFDBC|nr:hypothetical protein [Aurantiacibacter sp. 219JJ12-13]MDP5261654.1 hypothetical protein [Aurantiacibacter sp. 219JJ12-13]